jgi:hypothetical protein
MLHYNWVILAGVPDAQERLKELCKVLGEDASSIPVETTD